MRSSARLLTHQYNHCFTTCVQVREKVGTCRSPMLMRDYVDSCTGNLLLGTLDEDYRTYCKGWLPLISENCTRMAEYEFRYSSFNVKPQDFLNRHCDRSETQREAYSYKSDIRTYSGGGYELKMKGQIAKLKHKLSVLQNNDWIDNRTRALITEFSVYNPQVI